MQSQQPKLLLTSSPFLKQEEDTPTIMRHVIYSLIPVALAGIYYFGLGAFLVIMASVAGAAGTEWIFFRASKSGLNPLYDGSAILTGLLLALVLPPGIPLWMAFVGGVVAIAVGKLVFGGIGSNVFNPALVGRAFLQAAFPVALTTWVPNVKGNVFAIIQGQNFSVPFLKAPTAAVTSATPLAEMKFEAKMTGIMDLMLGNVSGSLGETCGIIILLGGIYLAARNFLNWRIPVSIFATIFLFSAILYWIDPANYAPPMFHLFSGGLMLGAVFMATDPVTSPITQRGCWIFGLGIGVLVVVIRNFGGLPEGVMYAILLMNAVTPLINRLTQPRIYGEVRG
ncbi:MAG: RnfABCDGE type electron transport complex subunit D [candidate division Zixibacteria bacterium]|nr:RnfABCDGE type electron transport complex subunit D [candidate division Zixibacteria bacterium]